MKTTILTLLGSLLLVSNGHSSIPSDHFQHLGMTRKSVIGSLLQKIYPQAKEPISISASSELIDISFQALSQAEEPRTKEVDYTYILSLLTGSSLEFHKLMIYMDSTGNGYFQQGKNPVVYFHSSELETALEKYAKKTEQGAAANP